MALFQAAIIEKNRATVDYTLLLNTKLVVDYYQDSDGKTVFHYANIEDRRDSPVEYKYDGTRNAFKVLLSEATINDYVKFTGIRKINDFVPTIDDRDVAVDRIIRAIDITGTTNSYVYYQNGAFGVVKLETPYTIDEIDSSASGSGSLGNEV